MKDIEKMLREHKSEIDEIEVPEALEGRLQEALEKRTSPRPINRLVGKRRFYIKVAVVLIAFMLVGYQFDAMTYYGKKFLGYDQVLEGTLKQLNELGKGQEIGKSHTFSNGASITVDGIMLDDNQLIIFYTVKDPGGNADSNNAPRIWSLKGFWKRYTPGSGYGKISDDKTEVKYVESFETPVFLEKGLTLEAAVQQNGSLERGEISFFLNRNEAMGHTLKRNIHKSIEVDETKITFESISASPTTTVVKGSLQNILQLAADQLLGERFRPNGLDLRLIANGKELASQSAGMGTDMNGMTFDHQYEPLPRDLKQLQLRLVSFGADHDVKTQVEIKKDGSVQDIDVLNQQIRIEKVEEKDGETYITITTEESVILTRVYLLADGYLIKLKETIADSYDKTRDGKIQHTRTLHYPGRGEKIQLDIQRMTYEKIYDKIIDIPLN